MSEHLEVKGEHPVWSMDVVDLAIGIAYFVSACVKDGVPVNGS